MRDEPGAGHDNAPRPDILLTADQPSDVPTLEAILANLGQNVISVRSGDDALHRLLQQDFAVVVLAVPAPGPDGFAVAQRIRNLERSRHTPILFVVASDATDFPIERAYELGAVDCVVQPIAPAVLRARTAVFVDLFQKAERLRRHEQGLRETNAARNQFLAMLRNELRNPLAAMLSTLYVLGQDDMVRDRHRPSLIRMERQGRRLNRLVEDLLEASRVVLGRARLRPERLDLARLVAAAVEERRPLLERVGVTLTLAVPETPVWVQGDADRLAQVLDNLLDNEARFVDRGGRADVRLTTDPSALPLSPTGERGRAEGAGQAVLTITDNGIGVAAEMQDRLFDVFAQVDQSLDRKRGGLGLGLAVVKGLVEQHGGTVRAASEGLGRGAVFTIRLPLEPEPAALSPAAKAPQATGARSRVLVIEDNHDAAESLRMLLEILGHEVRVAFTGAEGLKLALQWAPEVVLSDIGLPELDGYEVARRLRQAPGFRDVVLVAITGYNGEDDRRRAREAGFNHHLAKPADVRDLQRVLELRAS